MKKERLKDMQFDKKLGHSRVKGKFRKKSKNGKVKAKLVDLLDNLFPAADENNIPPIEKAFYEDQKTHRKMFIAGTYE